MSRVTESDRWRELWRLVREQPAEAVLQRAFSFRLIGGALLLALLVGAFVAAASPTVGAIITIVLFLATYGVGVLNPVNVLYCPHCRKRVKAGASVCHHCGRNTLPGALQ